MPYIFVDEVPEDIEEAEVVPASEVASLQEKLNEVEQQRDEAIERAVAAEDGWKKSREKYANAFLTTPNKVKEEMAGSQENLSAQSISSLFKIG